MFSDIDCRIHSDFRGAELEKIQPWSSLSWELIPPPPPFLSYCHVCVTHSKLSLGDTHGMKSFHLSFHTLSAAYIPLSPNKMKHTVLVCTRPILCFLCWTLAMSVRESGIMPDSKVVVGVCAEVTVPFPTRWMQVWRGPCSVHIHHDFHEPVSANLCPRLARTAQGFRPFN